MQGCGTGTFKYTLDGISHPLDAGKGYVPADETWSIDKGSGTGGLVGIGSGLNHRTGGVHPDGSAFGVYDPATNSLTCIPSHRNVGIAPASTLPMTGIGLAGASLGLATLCGGLLLLRLRRRVLSASG